MKKIQGKIRTLQIFIIMWEVFFYFYHVLTFRYNLNKRNNNMAFLITKMLSSHSCKKHYIAPNDSHSYSFYMHTS